MHRYRDVSVRYLELFFIISPHADSIDLPPLAQERLDLVKKCAVLLVEAEALCIHAPVEDILRRLGFSFTTYVLACFVNLEFCAVRADLVSNPWYIARFIAEKSSHALERGNGANGDPVFRRLRIKCPHVLVVWQVRVVEVEFDYASGSIED